jgi:hypothetical protein
MAQYSFPILENDELLPCLEEMEIPLTAAQIAKPTYEVVAPLFESMLINLTGVTRSGHVSLSSLLCAVQSLTG